MSSERSYVDGEFIFREGETANYAYVLKTGTVEILKIGAAGEEVLAELSPNSIFGEMALIDGVPRSASARSKGDTIITEVTTEAFKGYIQNNPSTALRIMRTISENLRAVNIRLAQQQITQDNTAENSAWSQVSLPAKTDVETFGDTDAIYQRKPSRPLFIVTGSVLLFFVFAVVFASFNKIETTVSASGKFTTRTPNVVLESKASSTVRRVTVERGDRVEKGDIVAELDDTIVFTNLRQNDELLDNLDRKIRRIEIEKSLIAGKKEVGYEDELGPLNLDTLKKRISEYQQSLRSFGSKLLRLQTEQSSTEDAILISREQTLIKEQIRDVQKKLYEAKTGTLFRYLSAQDAVLDARRAQFNAEDSATKVGADIGALKADRSAFQAKWASKLSTELTDSAERYTQLMQERVKLQQSVDNILVRAPVGGVILDLPAVSEGGVVNAGDEILTIVQTDQALFLEVDIAAKDISDIRLGMEVSVKVNSMPFQEFGDIEGVLIFVSQDTFAESLSGESGVFYRGRVKTVPLSETDMPSDFLLSQGMQASADLKVGNRRLITYFIHPILGAFEESFREPD
jgi:hemolysin D